MHGFPKTLPILALASVLGLAPAVDAGPQAPGGGRRILFVRGGSGTGGFLDGGADEHLSDVFDTSTAVNNHGWGELGALLSTEGYVVEQVIEGPVANNTPVDFAQLDLAQYSVVVLGSNNADYPPEAVDLIEEFVHNGGGLLVISDASWGLDWGDAPSSDQAFLDRFGLIMNQDTGLYTLSRPDGDFVVGGVDMGRHVTLAGPDGLVGTPDDVDHFDGEGVSPITIASDTGGLVPRILAKAEGTIHVNDNTGSGSYRPATEADGALVVVEVGGRVAAHFDRNTFFNENGAGTSIARFDNTQYAQNLFAWLAGDAVSGYGRGKVNSLGLSAFLVGVGEPSAAAGGFRIDLLDAIPATGAVAFFGTSYADAPFQGGSLLVGGTITRMDPFTTGDNGMATIGFRVLPEMVGTSIFFQVWYRDLQDSYGVGLSGGLRARLLP